jgi:uncharacterized membrane protein
VQPAHGWKPIRWRGSLFPRADRTRGPYQEGAILSLRDQLTTHRLFQISLLAKLAHSVIEVAAGLALLVVKSDTIMAVADFLTRNELRRNPYDLVANLIMRGAQSLSFGSKRTAVVFLLSHGIIELALVSAIFSGKRWAYPAFMAALSLLILYQCFQIGLRFSPWLAALTVFDVGVLFLTWHEYAAIRGRLKPAE